MHVEKITMKIKIYNLNTNYNYILWMIINL